METVIDKYIMQFDGEIKQRLNQIRETIKRAAPQATEKISYNMPAFYFNGNLVYFAANKNYIGFYPTPSAIMFFKKELKLYKTSKGAIQFSNSQPVPYDLIRRITEFRVAENKDI